MQARSFLTIGNSSVEYKFTAPYSQLPLMVLLGAILGAFGAAWVSLNASIVKLRTRWNHSRPLLLLEVRLCLSEQAKAMLPMACACLLRHLVL
jgi:H+/Cl- antiporter ClcA